MKIIVTHSLLLQYPFLRKWMRKNHFVIKYSYTLKCFGYYFNPIRNNTYAGDIFNMDIPKIKFKNKKRRK